jgi:hypothetical protein
VPVRIKAITAYSDHGALTILDAEDQSGAAFSGWRFTRRFRTVAAQRTAKPSRAAFAHFPFIVGYYHVRRPLWPVAKKHTAQR